MRILAGLLLAVGLAAGSSANGAPAAPVGSVYMTPPSPIPEMLAAAPTPSVSVSRDRRTLAIFGRENLPSVAALARPILRLGGYRIDPRTNGQAEIRMNWLTSLSFETIADGKTRAVNLPKGVRFTQPQWSPDGKTLAFVVQAPTGLALWVAEAHGEAKPVTGPVLNAAFGTAYQWLPDSSGLLVARTMATRGAPPAESEVPTGPTVQESTTKASAIRTYEDLLSSPHDEDLFDYYFTAQLERVDLSGATHPVGKPGLYYHFDVSPDGRYVQVERLKRPYSYLVPAGRFPAEIAVWTISGQPVKTIADRPLTDNLPAPFDAVTPFPREVEWRADAPATLVWAVAQDGGDTDRKVASHDRVLMQDAPFTGEPRVLADLKDRFARIVWGRNDTAFVITRRIKNRHETWTVVDPSGQAPPRVLLERNYQDQYNNPGAPMTTEGPNGRSVMAFAGPNAVVFSAPGSTREGDRPFLADMDLATGKESKVWQAEADAYETPVALLGGDAASFVSRRESATEPPNYWVHGPDAKAAPRALTHFTDPEPQFAKVQKQLIAYKRADGVGLSGTLYLPAGYDAKRDGPLPLLMWAYPAEFTDAAVAGQVVDREKNRFSRPQGINQLFMVTQGYAVLDGPSFPIIGENGKEPNDTYVEQLTADAQAAVDAVVAMGVTDRDHIAVGGHSYGAFMTANLLAHTDLFRAGIARSGAYNRTLTPFGFQNEQRTYWQAEDTYNRMSPFAFAPRIKAPILLIHGMADDNSGTFPIQSERFYAALKGAGATVRYVQLPNEPHGYRGRESTLHTLWEMTNWLDRYVKHAPPRAAAKPAETAAK